MWKCLWWWKKTFFFLEEMEKLRIWWRGKQKEVYFIYMFFDKRSIVKTVPADWAKSAWTLSSEYTEDLSRWAIGTYSRQTLKLYSFLTGYTVRSKTARECWSTTNLQRSNVKEHLGRTVNMAHWSCLQFTWIHIIHPVESMYQAHK